MEKALRLKFPFLFGGTFIEAEVVNHEGGTGWVHFPSFSEGLSLRLFTGPVGGVTVRDFPSFSEGLSLRLGGMNWNDTGRDFPSFSEGLSLRPRF